MKIRSLTTLKQNELLAQSESDKSEQRQQTEQPTKLSAKYPAKILNLVQRSLNHPIRSIEHKDEYITIEIQNLAQSYGTRVKIEDHVIRECVGLVLSKFSSLGVDELSEAFRLASIGDLGNIDMATYGGMFNTGILGRVLGAYRNYRRGIQKDIINSGQLLLESSPDGRQAAFDKAFPGIVEKEKGKYTCWEMAPEFWFKPAMRLGLIVMDKVETEGLYWRAVDLARSNLQTDFEMAKRVGDKRKYADALFLLERGVMVSRVGWAYRKLVVFEKLALGARGSE